ncbi:hypothetical protein [Dactylosporangium sp. NPDC049140]|uniref:hypothetical protein n=1 Tax=Dactylosporangium sp. NPDC049140 TaxID=3155647 RepID=UPI0033F23639
MIAADAAVRLAERDRAGAGADAQVADAAYAQAKRDVDQARRDVSVFVTAAYKGGGFAMFNSVLDSGGPNDLALRIEYLNHIAQENQAAVDELTAARMYAKQCSDTSLLALRRARDAADAARRSLATSQAAQAGAEQAAADVQALLDRSAQAEATAGQERGAVLARYEEMKADSDKVAEQLRAEAQAESPEMSGAGTPDISDLSPGGVYGAFDRSRSLALMVLLGALRFSSIERLRRGRCRAKKGASSSRPTGRRVTTTRSSRSSRPGSP